MIRRLALGLLATLSATAGLNVPSAPVSAAAHDIVTYVDPAGNIASPTAVAQGPDGNVWFVNEGNNRIGRITPTGDITTFTDPAGLVNAPTGISPGPDGNVWFTSYNSHRIGFITPAGAITTFTDSTDILAPRHLALGLDDNLWYTDNSNNHIGRITPSGEATSFADPANNVSIPDHITLGPDGNMWFTSSLNDRIGRITPAGAITTFTDPAGLIDQPEGIAAGPDGALWFTSVQNARIGRITTAGAITSFASNSDAGGFGTAPMDIDTGPDGALYFTTYVSGRIGRITTAGVVTTFPDPAGHVVGPHDIILGPNRKLWFVSTNNNRIGRFEPANRCNGTPPPHGFSDVPSGVWYADGLKWAKCNGLVTGFPDNTYRPGDPVNRGQAANILWSLVDRPVGALPNGFSDIPPGAWYGPGLDWVKEHGVVSGFPGNLYRPGDPVNRGQIVAWLWNLVGQPAGVPHGFSDVPAGAWYGPALDWAKVAGLVTGFPDNTYRPGDPVNRGQIVAILDNLASNGTSWSNWAGPELSTWRF